MNYGMVQDKLSKINQFFFVWSSYFKQSLHKTYSLFIISVISTFVFCAEAKENLDANLLKNPGFEEEATPKTRQNICKHWIFSHSSKDKQSVAGHSTDARTGKHSLKISLRGPQKTSDAWVSQRIKVIPGSKLRFRLYSKGTPGGRFFIQFMPESKKEKLKPTYMGFFLNRDWKMTSCEYTVPEAAEGMVFIIHMFGRAIRSKKTGFDAFFDDLVLETVSDGILTNKRLTLRVNPLLGGCIDSFIDKQDGFNYTIARRPGAAGGMGLDIIPGIRNPGMLAYKLYESKVVKTGMEVRLSRQIDQEELKGLYVEKNFSLLDRASPRIKATVKVKNNSRKTLSFSYRIHNVVKPDDSVLSFPTRDWLTAFIRTPKSILGKNSIVIDDMRAGWFARSYKKHKTLLMKFENARIQKVYAHLGKKLDTMEWYYSTITLKPGADWRTEYSLELSDSQPGKVYSGKIDYGREPLYIEAIKMPPIPKSKKLLPESLRGRFPFGMSLTSLQLARLGGLPDKDRRRENCRRQMREIADNYFNHAYSIALLGLLDQLGNTARRYKMTVAPVMHIALHNDIDVKKYRKKAKDFIRKRYNPAKYRDVVKRNKDIILAYYTGDELQAKNAACMVLGQEILKKELDHPEGAFFPYLNLGTLGDPLIPYLPVDFGDYYPIYNEERKLTRNPWSVYNMVKTAVAKFPDKPVWFMPQCFGGDPKEYIYALPTAAELRIMLYSAVAAGAKGIVCFGMNSAPSWLAKGGGPARTVLSGDGGYYPERWKALGECGRELTAIGPRLLSCSPDFKYTGAKIESPEIRKSTMDVVVYKKAALTLDVLKDRGNKFRYLAIINQDDKKTQEGTLSFSGDAVKQKCYNLTDSTYIDTGRKFKMTLRPGDAKFFIIGNADYIKPEIEQVFTNRFDREKVRFIIAADRAGKNGIKIPAIPKGKGKQAYRRIIAVQQQLQKNIANSEFGKIMRKWQETRQILNKIDLSLRENLSILIPPKIRRSTPYYTRFPKAASSEIHALLNQIDRNFSEYWRLDREIEAGRALKNKQQIANLSAYLSENYRALEKVISNKQ